MFYNFFKIYFTEINKKELEAKLKTKEIIIKQDMFYVYSGDYLINLPFIYSEIRKTSSLFITKRNLQSLYHTTMESDFKIVTSLKSIY